MEVKVEEVTEFLRPELIERINRAVTEEEFSLEGEFAGGTGESYVMDQDFLGGDNLEFAHEDDYHQVIERGSLEGLRMNVELEFGDRADVLDLVSYVIEYIASRQIFGNGNKRTSYITGMIVLIACQVLNGRDSIVYVELTDEFVDLIGQVAIVENPENQEDIREYLSELEDEW